MAVARPAPRLSVVIPVYNEAENIRGVFDALHEHVATPLEVLVVYDFDADTTVPVVRRIADRYPFRVHLAKNRLGRGVLKAIRSGFVDARCPAVLVVMGDLSDDLRIVDRMYALLMQQGYDIVCGSRYMAGGRQIGGPRLKGLLSWAAGLSLHYLTGLPTRDVTNSFKMYRKALLDTIEVESTGGFEIAMELTVKAFVRGGRIAEIPSIWTDRTAGESRFQLWHWLPKYLRWYLYAFRRYLPMRVAT
jgi:glycosyltransferase involved in cell wall biosynthesis